MRHAAAGHARMLLWYYRAVVVGEGYKLYVLRTRGRVGRLLVGWEPRDDAGAAAVVVVVVVFISVGCWEGRG